jgi:hypothetical protein
MGIFEWVEIAHDALFIYITLHQMTVCIESKNGFPDIQKELIYRLLTLNVITAPAPQQSSGPSLQWA